ncbi:hypothetical protein I6E74_00480 [Salinibacterium sp. SWN139]|uniref:hypothetical protein n=1 Tax=Salinibacterium sp. SWN139 TaxID=2792055 RepID=UPI0018CED1BD|nr:hypothetical protein [Salinibacterium sp. SWN139]MBH0052641.1 hypothetical protein [Salinibacterium sp. SWN139]
MTATPEERLDSAPTPVGSRPHRRIKDMAAFLGCVAVAVALGSVFVVAASPYYGSTALRMLHTLAQASAVGLPVAALFGVPAWLWLSARVPARPLLIALLIAVSPLVGIVPGVVVLTAGLTVHADPPVFLGLGMIAGGAWSAPIATALYYLVLGKRPLIAIALGGVVVVLALLGWVSIWGSAG